MSFLQTLHTKVHNRTVFGRRVERLADAIAGLIPRGARVLDIGCGSGTLAMAILARRPDIRIEGIDVLVRPDTDIPVTEFDGTTIPWPDNHFDVCLFVDVLHHVTDPEQLVGEAQRVARSGVIIKDHLRDGVLAGPTLRLMDWFGNASHGVVLPYNYLTRGEWQGIWQRTHLSVRRMTQRIGLYPRPFSWIFDRDLHFVAELAKCPA